MAFMLCEVSEILGEGWSKTTKLLNFHKRGRLDNMGTITLERGSGAAPSVTVFDT